jgi:hypothetical protein
MKAKTDTRPLHGSRTESAQWFRPDAALWGAASIADGWGAAMARFAELQAAMLAARTPYEAWICQYNWLLESATQSVAFWQKFFDAATRANAGLLSCGQSAAGVVPRPASAAASRPPEKATHA